MIVDLTMQASSDSIISSLVMLRGRGFPGDVSSPVPCIETSDDDRLCPHPIVSVLMLTFNHAKYIRQAVESVMMQRTDFDYELIIGEDASTDGTRKICFDLQKKYPEWIRVLWSEKNLYAINGNIRRVNEHVRGEYVAFLEGDDYWTDECKLQKQVDLIRRTNAVGCMAKRIDWYSEDRIEHPDEGCDFDFVDNNLLFNHYFHTSTYIFRTDVWRTVRAKCPEITEWYDTQIAHCMADAGKICFLSEEVSVYRRTGEGIATSQRTMYDRIALSLSQTIPMYLYGPVRLRHHFSLLAMREIAHLGCPYLPEYDSARYASMKPLLYFVFFNLLKENIHQTKNWMWLVKLIYYRGKALFSYVKKRF